MKELHLQIEGTFELIQYFSASFSFRSFRIFFSSSSVQIVAKGNLWTDHALLGRNEISFDNLGVLQCAPVGVIIRICLVGIFLRILPW